ncbi:anaphase-promoting complex subunit 10 [Ctenocephalides felis]|uniref:anaphase-promoting complex subunit 10 n=2 Tax=Ctenocephalides felis TaxID=7515 RepID=UPI000E6E3D38|nr:anaphase-promoting complex subunit 10 [Ctenocephalides felis]
MSTQKEPETDPAKVERTGTVREVGNKAIWSLSSCKPGFGVDQIRDDCIDTYWQSDGQLPHLVNIQFLKKTLVCHIYIYTDYKLDESYTPSRISIRAGTHFNDLQEVEIIELSEPTGWVVVPIKDAEDRPIKTFMLQIAVVSNHQNGRDTHMRQVRVHAPLDPYGSLSGTDNPTSEVFKPFMTIR